MSLVALSASRRRASTTVRRCAARTTLFCMDPAAAFVWASTAAHSYAVSPLSSDTLSTRPRRAASAIKPCSYDFTIPCWLSGPVLALSLLHTLSDWIN